jgi:hypothetical protein
MAITDFDENFDTKAGKEDQEKFLKKLNEIYPKIKSFRSLVLQAKERYKNEQQNYLDVINMLSLYEKETINDFVNNDENKLVFFNMKNQELCQNIQNAQEQVINPYDRLYDAITEDYLNTEAMIGALESLKDLQDTYSKLIKHVSNTKNKEKENNKEKNANDLGEIIKIATFNMQNTIDNFKVVSLDNYYAELTRIDADTEKNSKIFDDLWETVVKDKNISEFN